MARIETYTAQRNLVPGSTPGIELINPVAQETQNIGNTMSQFAGVLQQRAEQRENFKVENDYRKMQLDLQAQMEEQAASMPPDGSGFHDKFVAETFRPRRDQFLAGVPERLKPKFQALLDDASGADATEWSIKAASTERDQNYAWQRDEIKLTTDQTAVAISMDPDAYDNYLEQGRGLINNSSLPTPEKDKLLRDWENTAQISMLNQLLEKNPSGVLRELGYDPRRLSPTTQFALLSKAVQWQESSDNPNAVSGKGAVGLMQVMPATAAEIAAKMGDTNFPAGDGKENRDAVNEYLSNPAVNKQYGEFYLREQLRAFAGANDPIEAALVAYNAGPSVAQKWVESGYDDKILPKETRDYKDNIMSSLKSQPVKGDPSSVQFVFDGQPATPARGSGARFTVGKPAGLLQAGNVDLYTRPRVQNADGTVSTVRSMSFEEDGVEVLIPTVSPDGKVLSDKEAIALYRSSGQHLGKFTSARAATTYANSLHKQQEAEYGSGVAGVNPDLQNRVADAFSTLGLTKVKVNSGFRDPIKNKAVGGADKSQHLDGNAMDIDVSGMKNADKVELLKALSAAGVTGLGIYGNAIHADLGGRRAWGPSHHADSIPAWAAPVIAQHLNGTTPPPRAVDQRYASLPYTVRQQFQAKADQLITTQTAAEKQATAVQKVAVRRDMENELALIRKTGQGSATFDSTNVSTILGEDDYMTFERKRDVAQRSFTATSGIATMSATDMEQRFSDYAPDPASPDFADQQQVQSAVQKEIDRVTGLRRNSPDKAALEVPEVKGVYDALQQKLTAGDVEPTEVQNFVRTMLGAQADFGIAPEARAPVTREWAMEIGKSLSRVPDLAGKNQADVRNAVLVQYQELQKYFGDYTDEVIVYALSEYKGLSKPTADMIGGYMKAISVGGDPFRLKKVDQSLDADQVDGFNVFGWYPFGGAPDTEGMTPEEALRQQQPVEE